MLNKIKNFFKKPKYRFIDTYDSQFANYSDWNWRFYAKYKFKLKYPEFKYRLFIGFPFKMNVRTPPLEFYQYKHDIHDWIRQYLPPNVCREQYGHWYDSDITLVFWFTEEQYKTWFTLRWA